MPVFQRPKCLSGCLLPSGGFSQGERSRDGLLGRAVLPPPPETPQAGDDELLGSFTEPNFHMFHR